MQTLKTSEEWTKDPTYAGLIIMDPGGWPREPKEFDFHWFEEKINKQEFENRMCRSTIIWSLPKL